MLPRSVPNAGTRPINKRANQISSGRGFHARGEGGYSREEEQKCMQGPTRSSFRVCDHFIYVHAMVCSFAVPKSHELLLIVRKSSKPGSARASSEVFARCCWNRPGLRWLHYFELLFPVRWVWFEEWVEVPAQNSGPRAAFLSSTFRATGSVSCGYR